MNTKRELAALQREGESSKMSQPNPGESSHQSKRQKSTQSTVYCKECIFCKKTRYRKKSHTREDLIQAVDIRADATLRQIAIAKEDATILAVTSREIVAAEAHYHRSCYREYTRHLDRPHHTTTDDMNDEMESTDDGTYTTAERDSYVELFEYIREEVLTSPDVITLSNLTSRLTLTMKYKGATDIKPSTRTHIRRKLEREFGSSIHIFPDDKGKLLLVPDNLSVFELAKMYHATKQELERWRKKSTDDNSVIDKASSIMRASIKSMDNQNVWPYHPADTNKDAVIVPNELKQFFGNLLTSKFNKTSTSQKVDLLIESFSQDLIYAVTGGQHKPPKHILLACGVKTLTGNVELIQILNRLGHTISYSQLQENDTALCLQKLAAASNKSIILPENIQPYLFTNLAFDNIDRLEETLSGGGTSHRVNGIAVQPRVYGPHPPKQKLPAVPKMKQRSIMVDEKPLQVYISGERVGPNVSAHQAEGHDDSHREPQNKDLVWMLTRQVDPSNQIIPSWTGFNIRTRNMISVSQDIIGYLPVINAPATEMATVLETVKKSEAIRLELKLDEIVVVMDQALYAKAAEIVWKHHDNYKHIVIRLGAFHTTMTVLAILGKRFQDAGLRDLCIESGLIVQGSVSGVLEGRMYNRAVRVHKAIYEGLLRTVWKGFIAWMEANHSGEMERVTALMAQVNDLHGDLCQERFDLLLAHEDLTETSEMWSIYLDHLRLHNGDLSAFWMSYIEIVGDILLGLIRASREGDWDLHLSAIRKLIPWCFAYDRVNYARYLPAYLAQMRNLEGDHPAVYENFRSGGFSVQLAENNPFGRLPVDQTTEMTINKDTQTVGGTTKFSQKSAAVSRYFLTAEFRSGFLGHLRDMTRTRSSALHHSELQKPRIEKDEKNASAVAEVLENWINPFEDSHELVCISTAATATPGVRDDLIEAYDKGEQAYTTFKAERLESDPPKQKFHDPLQKQKLKTFSNISQKRKTQTQGKTLILKTDRSLFGRIVVIAQSRNLEMREVFRHPLGPLPWSLATPEGTPRKTPKAVLAKHLQKLAAPADGLPDGTNTATIIDGMSFVQKVKADVSTFGDIAKSIHGMIRREAMYSNRVDVVFDTYEDISIKTIERTSRGEEQGLQLNNITATQLVRQWRSFLKQVNNKSSLIEFFVREWQKAPYTDKLADKELFVTHRDKCWKITGNECKEVPELTSKHEEADGRLILHAAHAVAAGHTAIVICSEDTDVFILSLVFSEQLGVQIFQKCGTQNRTQLVDVGKICSAIGPDVCKALIGMHAMTGCDTVSAFAGKGKLRSLEIVKKNKDMRESLMQLGDSWRLSTELQSKLEAFVCLMYAPKPGTNNVNDLRYNLFCSRKGEVESHQLPPCQDCLKKHSERANFQAAIWKRSILADPNTPVPVRHGWKMEEGHLVIDWMDGSPAPEAVLDLLSCKCSRVCKLPSCVCLLNGLKCTDMCRLRECTNQPSMEDSETDSTIEDGEDDDTDEEVDV